MEFLSQLFIDNAAPIMFVALVVFLLSGFPVAFSLAAVGLFFAIIGMAVDLFEPTFLQALPNRIYGIMANDTLLAIPFFTFMGLILERTGMAEDLLDTIGQLFGPIRGGVAYAVVFVGALLAATTGVVAASVISMGLISLPIMLRYGYDRRVASGVIAASGTLAQIIPPSLVLIIMADQLGRSVGDMYAGAFVPGLVLSGLYMGFIFLVAMFFPKMLPALPAEARTIKEDNGRSGLISLGLVIIIAVVFGYVVCNNALRIDAGLDEKIVVGMLAGMGISWVLAMANKVLGFKFLSNICERVIFVLIPPLLLIFLVLGTIFLGIATPTEGGAMGAVGAMLMAILKGKINWDIIRQASRSTAKLSAFVLFILVGSTVFALVFRGVNGDVWVEHLLTSLPGGQTGFLIAVNILFFILAFFLDFFELAFILVPLVGPVAEKLGIDLIWFGVLLGVNMQTSFMHPPFGFALFYLRSVAAKTEYIDVVTKKLMPPVKTSEIYWGAVPFVVIQVIMVGLIIAFPNLVQVEKKVVQDNAPLTVQLEEEPTDPANVDPANSDDKDSTEEEPELQLHFSTDNNVKKP